MLNPRKAITAAAVTFALTLGAFAQGAAPATTSAAAPATTAANVPVRIGVIYFEAAIANTNEGIRDLDALQKKFEPKQTELKNLNDEVENLKKQLAAAEAKLSAEERATRARTIDTKQKNLQRNLEDAQTEFQQAQNEAFQRIFQKMVGVLENYARTNNYGVILDVSNPQNTSVLWASEATNITEEVVRAYDQANPATGAAAAPSAPSANRPAQKPATPAQKPPTTPR